MSNLKERLLLIVSHLNTNKAALEKELGMSNGYIANVTNNIKQMYIDRLLEKIPNLNTDWLLYGIGDMFNNPKKTNELGNSSIPDFIIETEKVCNYKYPYVRSEIVQSRDLSIKKLVQHNSDKLIEKSLIEFLGGGSIDYVQRVITSAMSPLFMPGDLLFIRFLPDDASIISGAIYLLDTKNYGAMVRQVYVKDETYTLHALNKEYPESTVNREGIYSFGLVVRMIRSDFNIIVSEKTHKDTFDMMGKLIDEVIEQNKRNDNLIKKITEK